jgi:hypothetical protein
MKPSLLQFEIDPPEPHKGIVVTFDPIHGTFQIDQHSADAQPRVVMTFDNALDLIMMIQAASKIIGFGPCPPEPIEADRFPPTHLGVPSTSGIVQTRTPEVVQKTPVIDPTERVYLLRHEDKDLFYTEDDMLQEAKHCSGPVATAYPFETRYAAQRFQQGFKHNTTILEAPAAYIVSARETQAAKRVYHSSQIGGTSHRGRAMKMTLGEAQKAFDSYPSSVIVEMHKVVA